MTSVRPEIGDFLDRHIAAGDFPGAVFLIAEDDRIVAEGWKGFAVREPESIPMQRDTIFDLSSLTKPLATMLLTALLEQEGRVRLTDRVCDHLPGFTGEDRHGRISPLIRRNRQKSSLRQRGQLVPPGVAGLGEAVQQQYQRSVRLSSNIALEHQIRRAEFDLPDAQGTAIPRCTAARSPTEANHRPMLAPSPSTSACICRNGAKPTLTQGYRAMSAIE